MQNKCLSEKKLIAVVYCRVATDAQTNKNTNDITKDWRKTMTAKQLEQIAALRRETTPTAS